jgi:pimeloyl-ACP methyl ester carboxylesterase
MEITAFHPFLSEQAKYEYLSYYDQRAKAWPIASETSMVSTFLGETFVRISGPENAPTLVLLPGSVFNSLMWMRNIEALSKLYRTYAVDNIYDCGRSVYSRAPKNPEDFVQWLDELFTALNLGDRINLIGLSYGSWLAHQYALRFPRRLAKIVLLAHPAIVSMDKGFIFRMLLAFVSPRYYANFVYWLLQDTAQMDEAGQKFVQEIFGDMQLAGRCYKPKAMVIPKVMKDIALGGLQVPALFLMGKNEKTFSPQKAIQRINRLAPHLQTEMLAGAGHDLNLAQADLVNRKVLEFLQSP